jgi:lycopene beta-cyclase
VGRVYDHVIVGAGLSGLLLARRLTARSSDGTNHRGDIAVVDPDLQSSRPATYAWWARAPHVLDPWAIGSWATLNVVDRGGRSHPIDLDGWTYTAVDWGRARADLVRELAHSGVVTFVPGTAFAVSDHDDHADVHVPGTDPVCGRWVYDSRPLPRRAPGRPRPARVRQAVELSQAFRGVWVHTAEPVFDHSAATLMDFSDDASPELGFVYTLPVSARSALVMAVRMGRDVTPPDPVPAVRRVAGRGEWSAQGGEGGETPLVVPRPPRRLGRRVLAIGQRGGRVRPSTGYAVGRILVDTEAICASLERHGSPFAVAPDPPWQRALDHIWLRALAQQSAGLEPAFVSLFAHASVDSVLRFLDGEARARDVLAVVRALPAGPFVRALV